MSPAAGGAPDARGVTVGLSIGPDGITIHENHSQPTPLGS